MTLYDAVVLLAGEPQTQLGELMAYFVALCLTVGLVMTMIDMFLLPGSILKGERR